jgi:hypothetical protein
MSTSFSKKQNNYYAGITIFDKCDFNQAAR